MKAPVKIPDLFIILFAAALVIFSVYNAYMKPKDSLIVLIKAQDKEWIYRIDDSETVKISGPIGDTVVRILDNRAWVESSPCENQNCVATGFISKQGQWTACLPNNVLLMVLGNEDDDVDAIVW